ncbi:MFS transporter [Bdellovibrio bacteriovorus]|uniref:MFS transporter n=1 Tax=Bdellovibrio bacteriovorus TaxID=959 RepID=A0A150WCZ6_BDEBC|nr:MFS transporter [Bdellovibrio bacteriovorus]KYG60856.1 MFS transporter [Bdellovibrio bacteriovorus]
MNESVWSPMKLSLYRSFWICAFLSNLGTWIQDVAASWVMTHLNTSPLVISLLAFSTNLPVLFLSIPAGIVADLGHRRRILLFAQGLMFLAAGLLAYLVWQEKITELSLLALALTMGIGFAMTNPAFQSVLTDLVPHPMQQQAVLVYYMGINITRVLGPTVGGGLLSAFGPSTAFLVNSISFLGLICFFWIWPVKEERAETKKKITLTEEDWKPLFSLHNLKLWVEIFFVTFCASSMWALYPTRGRVEMALNSWQYGSLLGCFGLGACVSAFLSERIMQPHRTNNSLAGSYIVYALGILLLGLAPNFAVLCLAMFLCGTGWLVLSTLMNMSSRQITGKSHLKATMLGVFLAVFYAGMAIGSVSWGAVARLGQTSWALVIAAVALALIGFAKGLRARV